MNNSFVLPEEADVADLTRFLERAVKLDPTGGVRLRAYGDVLTVYVAPIAGDDYIEHVPMILGLRTLELAEAAEFDLTVGIQAALDLLKGEQSLSDFSLVKRLSNGTKAKPNQVQLPSYVLNPAWANETPTRSGWELGGHFTQVELTEVARKGVAQVTETLPASVGGPIASRVRAEIWGKAIDYKYPVPMGAAFVAAGLGFLTEGEEVPWYVSGEWVRLSAKHGHVISKFALDYVPIEN